MYVYIFNRLAFSRSTMPKCVVSNVSKMTSVNEQSRLLLDIQLYRAMTVISLTQQDRELYILNICIITYVETQIRFQITTPRKVLLRLPSIIFFHAFEHFTNNIALIKFLIGFTKYGSIYFYDDRSVRAARSVLVRESIILRNRTLLRTRENILCDDIAQFIAISAK